MQSQEPHTSPNDLPLCRLPHPEALPYFKMLLEAHLWSLAIYSDIFVIQ